MVSKFVSEVLKISGHPSQTERVIPWGYAPPQRSSCKCTFEHWLIPLSHPPKANHERLFAKILWRNTTVARCRITCHTERKLHPTGGLERTGKLRAKKLSGSFQCFPVFSHAFRIFPTLFFFCETQKWTQKFRLLFISKVFRSGQNVCWIYVESFWRLLEGRLPVAT